METVTLKEALELFRFPRRLGEYEEKEVSVGIGRFGPYIKHNGVFVSLKKGVDDPATVTLETAVERILEKREQEQNKLIQEFEGGIRILKGRFGPYISYNKTNYRIPKTQNPEELTLEKCLELIEQEEGKKGKKKAPAKKAAAKKTTARTSSKKKE